ncbi:ECF transporter S component [Streptococcus sp. DD12]|uniref:ECF transporter S component n=1 Tax=Streptococcus sp. DD12 TaxID=1777880 RepID=UPI000793CD1D|nr:ECF transporter S component [Streptococcus sp. DD12]KXT75986.1 Substrate-specific component PdxU2 of putative pyridoxin-related ECF transporter [Streptococcus sp. DD12]
MRNQTVQRISSLAVLTALSVVLGYFVRIPTPTGMLTLLDAGIFFTAFTLGKKEAAIVGGLSGFLIDLISGYPQYMLVSLLAHGLQGYFAGWTGLRRPLGAFLACLSMVVIYLIAGALLYGIGASVAGVWGNIGQTVFGLLVGFTVSKAYEKVAH